jgi:PAS domain S-box-containing protein
MASLSMQEAQHAPGASRFSQLLDHAGEVQFRFQLRPQQKLHWVSAGVEALLGYTPAELIGREDLLAVLIHPDDRPLLRLREPPFPEAVEVRLRTSAGHTVRCQVRESISVSADGREVWIDGIVRNTGDDRDQDEQSRSDPRFQRLFEISAAIVSITDRNGAASYWSPGAVRALGISPTEPSLLDRVHPADATRLRHQLGELSASPEAVLHTTYRFRHGDGSWRTLESAISNQMADPSIRGLVASTHDITEQQRAQQAAQRSEEYHRELLSHLPGAVAVHRVDRIVYANRALTDLTGFTPRELLQRTLADLVPPEDREGTLQHLQAARSDRPIRSWEARIICRDGRLALVDVTAIPFRADDGDSVITFIRDVSEFKRVQEQIMLADRMISVGTLAGGVAHEINNPLAYVIGNLAYVQEQIAQTQTPGAEPVDWAEVHAAVRDSREGLDRVRRIVRDLRTFASAGESRGLLEVKAVVERCLNLAATEIRNRARLETHFADVPQVEGNEAQLSQVFLNLIINAVQAIPAGRPDEHVLRVVVHQGVRGVDVSIADTGAGIATDVLPRVFDPFFTTKPVGAATGLGLSICHSIVKSMGGTIRISTEVGHGTTVTVELPVRRTAAGQNS